MSPGRKPGTRLVRWFDILRKIGVFDVVIYVLKTIYSCIVIYTGLGCNRKTVVMGYDNHSRGVCKRPKTEYLIF